MSSYVPTFADRLRLAAALDDAADAGYGRWDGERFEAFPGLEHAAADFIAQALGVTS